MTGLMIWFGIGITPDRYILGLFVLALWLGKFKTFFLDWMPFLFILIAYDFLRGFADKLNPVVHFLPQIRVDQIIFGELPTAWLQSMFYHQGQLNWYDYLAAFFYAVHFALPLAFGFLVWVKRREQFKQFASAILYLSYSAFFTYLIFPAAPPWLAAKEGYISNIDKIEDQILASFPQRLNLPTVYNSLNPNLVAAIPSLHAAYPLIVLLFAYKFFGKKALLFLPYVLSVWMALIYLGEHYFIDVALGAFYASVFFVVSQKFTFTALISKLQTKKLFAPALTKETVE
jgi:hypothetical protein